MQARRGSAARVPERQLQRAVPILQGSSEEVRLDLEENIVECDALVMVYGETTPVWVRGQLRLYSKLKHRRKQPLKALAHLFRPAGYRSPISAWTCRDACRSTAATA